MLVKSKYNSLSYYVAPELFFVGKVIRNLPLEKETYINNYRTFELRKLGYLVLLSILKTNDKIFNLLSSLKILYKIIKWLIKRLNFKVPLFLYRFKRRLIYLNLFISSKKSSFVTAWGLL